MSNTRPPINNSDLVIARQRAELCESVTLKRDHYIKLLELATLGLKDGS